MLAGQVIDGFSLSLTVIVKVQLSLLPAASVAVLVTVVVPFGNVEPDAGLETTVTPGQLSVAVTLKLTTAEHFPRSFACVTFAGQVITGFSVSATVTVNEQVDVLPDASVAVLVTVVVPFGNVEPDAGLETTVTPGQLSVAVTLKLTTAEHFPGSFA